MMFKFEPSLMLFEAKEEMQLKEGFQWEMRLSGVLRGQIGPGAPPVGRQVSPQVESARSRLSQLTARGRELRRAGGSVKMRNLNLRNIQEATDRLKKAWQDQRVED